MSKTNVQVTAFSLNTDHSALQKNKCETRAATSTVCAATAVLPHAGVAESIHIIEVLSAVCGERMRR